MAKLSEEQTKVRIEVHEAEKIDGKRVQKVDIYYRFVGNLN